MGAFDTLCGNVTNLTFNSHQEMIEAALLWQVQEYQLSNGSFNGSIQTIHTSHIQMATVIRSKGFFVKGRIPKRTYTFTSVVSEGRTTHNGLIVHPDELILLTRNDDIDFTVSSTEDEVSIAIDKNFFDTEFKKYFNKPFEHDSTHKRLQLQKNAVEKFRTSVKKLLPKLMVQNEKLKSDSEFHDKTEHEILEIIFQSIDPFKERKITLDSHILANDVRNYLEQNHHKNISLSELCSSQKIPERTIRLAFNDLFGFSPKQYLKNYRLGKAHHELIMAKPTSDTVSSIAAKHGFTHMGRFTKNYKTMFLTTPYQTLKRNFIF